MAAAIGMVALLIVGTGISTYLVERRTTTESENRIAHIAMHDALTNLANRHQFTEALRNECNALGDGGTPFALLMVDLDRFKPINDTLGHPIGDLVLQRIANRLRLAARDGDIVARIGGDEFAIIAFGLGDPDAATTVANGLSKSPRPMIIEGNVVEISGSVGVGNARGAIPTRWSSTDIALIPPNMAG